MLFTRKPDLIIGPEDNPQTLRYHIIRWRGFQLSLHKWCRSDSDRALHDHLGDNISILLNGSYREWFSHAWEPARWKMRYPWIPYFRKAETPHRVELHRPWAGPVWTLWFRWPPRREWGFHCPKGWRHWREYIGDRDYYKAGVSTVEQGCS